MELKGVKPTLYRLPETQAAVQKGEPVFIPEGERDVDNLAKLGLAATTNSGGAGKWQDSLSVHLAAADVVILPDMMILAGSTRTRCQITPGIAKSIKVVELPGLPDKGDVSDWLAKGGTKEELLKMVAEALEWEAQEQERQRALQADHRPPLRYRTGRSLLAMGAVYPHR